MKTDQLLFSRKQTAHLLGVSTDFVKRLEAAGRLTPVRLSRRPTGMVLYRTEDIVELIGVDATADKSLPNAASPGAPFAEPEDAAAKVRRVAEETLRRKLRAEFLKNRSELEGERSPRKLTVMGR